MDTKKLTVSDIISTKFMIKNTDFTTVSSLLKMSEVDINKNNLTNEDKLKIGEVLKAHSCFSNFEEFIEAAVDDYFSNISTTL